MINTFLESIFPPFVLPPGHDDHTTIVHVNSVHILHLSRPGLSVGSLKT